MATIQENERKTVVILVDNVRRDLYGSVLAAYQMEQRGIRCYLEPLESYKAVLEAYRPGMIIFNHLTASHLVKYSKRLAEVGVLTAVLPNELSYSQEITAFLAGRFHKDAHIDVQFCWNEQHKQAVLNEGFTSRLDVIGVPRFDFYFHPWSKIFPQPPHKKRPVVLFVANFVLARFNDMPKSAADKHFRDWKDRSSFAHTYWDAIKTNHANRSRSLTFLNELIQCDRYHIIVRPHPSEDHQFYHNWFDQLPPSQKQHIELDAQSNIGELLLRCDISLACEMCTTVLESWIAKRPLVQLVFDRSSSFYTSLTTHLNVECEHPNELPALVDAQLSDPSQSHLAAGRAEHLHEWCNSPDGNSTQRMVDIIEEMLDNKPLANWSLLKSDDYLRGAKLRTLSALGLPYYWSPLLKIKHKLSTKYALKMLAYNKNVKKENVQALQAMFHDRLDPHTKPAQ
ncbi:MAG: hypothetical protein G8345_13480 [Magnetococcales bacterium]|nr:hypothetical protein [Magnetococcales bacterium]NGZ27886.1 hypothetical protein [Magnetococcales bacterium]